MKKILIFSDTAYPNVNGVSTTLSNLYNNLRKDFNVETVVNSDFPTLCHIKGMQIPKVKKGDIKYFFPKVGEYAVHIMTEGVLGIMARNYCLNNNIKYTTSLLTFWDSYLWKNFYILPSITKNLLKSFHSKSEKVMVSSEGIMTRAREYADNLVLWNKGVSEVFKPYPNKEKYRALYVGRVSKEKDIEKFLKLDIPHTKVVVGEGPYLPYLKKRFKNVIFRGQLSGVELAKEYSKASVLVFPSSFDTFGLVMIEAIACGTPVAALPVPGPSYVLKSKRVGCMNFDLKSAVFEAEKNFDYDYSREFIKDYSWEASTKKFINNIVWNNA